MKYVRLNTTRTGKLDEALKRLSEAIQEVNSVLAEMRTQHAARSSCFYFPARIFEHTDTKGGKRRETNARLSFRTACDLGFRGDLNEWERLMGAIPRP